MEASNDHSFQAAPNPAELIRIAAQAVNACEPSIGSVLSDADQQWFAARDAVAHHLARHSVELGIAEFRRAKMVADHISAHSVGSGMQCASQRRLTVRAEGKDHEQHLQNQI